MDPLLGPPTTEAGISSMFDKIAGMDGTGLKLADEWNASKKKIWSTSEQLGVSGYSKCIKHPKGENRFCYVIVRNAGHMTPS